MIFPEVGICNKKFSLSPPVILLLSCFSNYLFDLFVYTFQALKNIVVLLDDFSPLISSYLGLLYIHNFVHWM